MIIIRQRYNFELDQSLWGYQSSLHVNEMPVKQPGNVITVLHAQ